MGDDSRAMRVLGEGVARPRGRRRQLVDGGQARRDESVAGREQVAVVALFGDQVIDRHAQGFLARVGGGDAGEGGIHLGVLRQRREGIEGEHVIEEGAHALFQARAGQHAVDLGQTPFGSLQLALPGGAQQLVVGRGVPQEQGEARRQRIGLQALGAGFGGVGFRGLHDEQNVGADQHRLDRDREALVEILQPVGGGARLVHIFLEFTRCKRPAVDQPADAREKCRRAGRVGGGLAPGLAGEQELAAVRIDHQLRHAERGFLVQLELGGRHAAAGGAERQQAVGALGRRKVRFDLHIGPEDICEGVEVLVLGERAQVLGRPGAVRFGANPGGNGRGWRSGAGAAGEHQASREPHGVRQD